VICYESRKMKEHEKNYVTHDLELASIVHALKMWRHYLMGRRFELRTDHCGLKYLFDQPTLNARKARWLEFLCEFDLEIKHIKGKENKVAYALSNKVQEMHVASLSIFQPDLRQQIVNHTVGDELNEQVKDKLQNQRLEKRYEGYKLEEDGILTYKGRIYILDVAYLRRVVMDEIHQAPYSGNPGYHKTITTARKQYFFLGMKRDMAEYISRCMKCQQVKVEHQHPAGLLQALLVLEWKWEIISMDFITGLPMTWR